MFDDFQQRWQEAIKASARVQRAYNDHLTRVDEHHAIAPMEESSPEIRSLQESINSIFNLESPLLADESGAQSRWKKYGSLRGWLRSFSNRLNARFLRRQSEFNANTVHLLNELLNYVCASTQKMRELQEQQIQFFQQITPWIDVKIEELRQEQNNNVAFNFGRLTEQLSHEGLTEKGSHVGHLVDQLKMIQAKLNAESVDQERRFQEIWFQINRAKQPLSHITPETHDLSRLHLELEEAKELIAQIHLNGNGNGQKPVPESNHQSFPLAEDYRYHVYEDVFRGSEQQIQERQKKYLSYFISCPEPVVDLGCGRGEFLRLMKEAGKEAYGLEMNQYTVKALQDQGIRAFSEDILTHLRKLERETIGGVFSAQVVEHLPPDQVQQILTRLHFVMKPGSSVVIETQNPLSVFGYHHVYSKDPTHIFPVHPETLAFMMRYAGFRDVQIVPISPVPENEKLPMPNGQFGENGMGNYLKSVVEQLNKLLYSEIEYYAVGRRE